MEWKCRNCGAVIESSDLKVCPYCDNEITFEVKADKFEAASQDTSGISFELTFGGLDDEPVAVNDVQTIRNYAERMGDGGVLTIDASSPIHDIEWLSSYNYDGCIAVDFSKNNIVYTKDECTFEEFLSFYVDFYEGRFNPSLDESGFYLRDGGEEELPAKKLFQINSGTLSEERKKTLRAMCGFINSHDKRAEYINYFRGQADKHFDVAISDKNSGLFKKACALISAQLCTDETPIFWKDTAIFRVGKSGVMLTDKHLFFVRKRDIFKLPLKDIKSIKSFGIDREWCFNGNKNYTISATSYADDSLAELGVHFAFICSMARDLNGSGYKIEVN